VELDLLGVLRGLVGERYRIERELGGGGMSRLFLAVEEPLARRVVIKVLPPDLACRASIARFEREVALSVRLQHPHILPLLTAGGREDVRYHITPYLSSETLGACLRREGTLPPPEAVRLLRELADAVAYAHGHGVVHRDIKPENILLSGGHAVLADFGIARALAADGAPSLTASDVRPGTAAYMPPEPDPDERGDVYALAVVGWEMVTGSRPASGAAYRSDEEAAREVGAIAAMPPELRAVLARGLAGDPAQRYRTAAEFRDALAAASLDAPREERDGRRRRPFGVVETAVGAALVVVAAAVVTVVAIVRGRPPVASTRWDDNLVAIAPFQTMGPDLQVWTEGLMDVVGANLDGAGPLRTVPTTTSVAAWVGRPDLVSVRRLSGRTRARFVIYGTLVAVEDSLRLRAVVYDAEADGGIAEVDLLGGSRNVDRLADSLTIAALQAIAQRRPVNAVRLRQASLGTRSFAAYKAYLEGEQHYRANRLDSAQRYYEQAIRKDSAFALPYLRMRSLRRTIAEDDTLSVWFAMRAAELNRGLAPRDSMIVLADSLNAAMRTFAGATPRWLALARRRLELLQRLTTMYSDDPEAWYELGEARFHLGEAFGVDAPTTLATFERAVALDAAFRPAYIHAIELALSANDAPKARALVEAARRAGSSDAAIALVGRALDGASAREVERAADTLPPVSLARAAYMMRRWPDSTDWAPRLFLRTRGSAHAGGAWLTDSVGLRQYAVGAWLYRGQVRRAYATADTALLAVTGIYRQQIALLGGMPPGAAGETFRRWRDGDDVRWATAALPWYARQGDTASLTVIRQTCVAHSRRTPPSTVSNRDGSGLAARRADQAVWLGAYCASVASAYLALVASDTARALGAFAAAPDSLCGWWCAFDRVAHAQLLAARSRLTDAAAVLDRRPPPAEPFGPTDMLWHMERARVAERLADAPRAAAHYRLVAATWRNADPALLVVAREAEARLSRLR
jgi:serine/threonine-protein kinase